MRQVSGGVTAAKGFVASGTSAGIKRGRKPDVALVVSEWPAIVAGVFTRNRVQAAPVRISKDRVRKAKARAVFLTSGCANCLTGVQGWQDARLLGRVVARHLGFPEDEVLLASTGVIGRRLPVPRILRVIPQLVQRLDRAHHRAAAQAILTTDLKPKEVALQTTIQGRRCHVGGMAKGAGMIAPSMATLLSVITTDVGMSPSVLQAMLREAVAQTFNRISVDGDRSTNDTVFALANGASGLSVKAMTRDAKIISEMLHQVCKELAQRIVEDGEGVSRLMDVQVLGARSQREAEACVRQVAGSSLVKTMLAGADPNVGRIAAAAGASAARFDPSQMEVFIGGRRVIAQDRVLPLDKAVAKRLLAPSRVAVRIDLHAGTFQAHLLTCDLTEDYVKINAGYAT